MEIVKATDLHALGNLDFLAADGQVIAPMEGAECKLSTPAWSVRTDATGCPSRRPKTLSAASTTF